MNQMETAQNVAITRYPTPLRASFQLSKEEKEEAIAFHFAKIMESLGLDLNHPSLAETPKRVAKMYVEELFYGLDYSQFPNVSFIENDFFEEQGNLILIKDISLKSVCEHHFIPMTGIAHIAYVPSGKILGLSKLNRIVDYFARRPQLQERLNAQIADCISQLLETDDVAVAVEAKHFCICYRGIQDSTSLTQTHVLRGSFKTDPTLRSEFFKNIS